MTYPKIFTHRTDHNSKVVIANAEQESQLPADYLPPVILGDTGQTMSGADAATQAMLSPEYDALLAERENLETERTKFAELVNKAQQDAAAQAKELADGRAQLQVDRDKLTEGYKASVAQLEADRATLTAEIEGWNKTKDGEPPADVAPPAEPTPAAASATPAKRTRQARD